MNRYNNRLHILKKEHESLISRKNKMIFSENGIFERYKYPILTAAHTPLEWRYDLNPETNPYLMERIGVNATMNSGAIKWNGKYLIIVRVEGNDRKSFFAIAESPNGIDNFRFWEYPIHLPDTDPSETNVYDIRLTTHEDGWIYGIFCSESLDPNAAPGDLSSAIAKAGIVRTKDLKSWERLPNLISQSQQRNVVLHPEFVNGKYALYTRPQDNFIDAGNGGGIGWALIDDITHAEVKEEIIINHRHYHKRGKEWRRSPSYQNPQRMVAPRPWSSCMCCRSALCTLSVYDIFGRSDKSHCRTGWFLIGTYGRRENWRCLQCALLKWVDCRRGRNSVYLLRIFRYPHARSNFHRRQADRLLSSHPGRRFTLCCFCRKHLQAHRS